MAKPIIQSDGLELHPLKAKHVIPFCNNLSPENVREFQVLYKSDPVEALMDVLNDDLVHVVTFNGEILAVCGMDDNQLWTLFSRNIKKHWRKFVKASPVLINFYHHFYDEITCDVWSENEFIHSWLIMLGFDSQFIGSTPDGEQIVHFVRCNSWYYDIDSDTSRPVIH